MPKSANQKLKLLYIAEYLKEKSDEMHPVSAEELRIMLAGHDIEAERKSIYTDIEALRYYGMDIEVTRGRSGGIKLLSKDFELTELKLLVDAVQSSRFITEKKSYTLIKKISSLASEYDRKELQRFVFISNRIKTENESIYYSTDNIYKAINTDKQISFYYFNYGADKKKKYHNCNKPITASPFALQFDSDRYYMIAFDSNAGLIKHYRVDKMEKVKILSETRDGKGYFRNFDLANYANATVTMFGGDISTVTLECPDEFAGAVIDKFGKKCRFIPNKKGSYSVTVKAALSPTFYSWVFTFGGKIKITAPQRAVDEYKQQLTGALESCEL
ncbi:MAG: WYL domain-containing protein [Clostridia bacterium]|nr:WYL domain-containing protein [Clostridia bacterium]